MRGSALEKDAKETDMIVAALRRAVYVRIMGRRVKELRKRWAEAAQGRVGPLWRLSNKDME